MVTHKVRILNDYSFDPSRAREEKGALNSDTVSEEVTSYLCREALPTLLNMLADLRIRFPNFRVLQAKANVTDAFRNIRVVPDQAVGLDLERQTPHPSWPRKRAQNWDTTVDLLGFTVNTYTLRTAVTEVNIATIRLTVDQEWPLTRKQAIAQKVLSVAGKLWNLTYVVKAGRYFVWQLLALTGLHKNAKTKEQTRRIVDIGWEFHNDIAFWKWAIDQQ